MCARGRVDLSFWARSGGGVLCSLSCSSYNTAVDYERVTGPRMDGCLRRAEFGTRFGLCAPDSVECSIRSCSIWFVFPIRLRARFICDRFGFVPDSVVLDSVAWFGCSIPLLDLFARFGCLIRLLDVGSRFGCPVRLLGPVARFGAYYFDAERLTRCFSDASPHTEHVTSCPFHDVDIRGS